VQASCTVKSSDTQPVAMIVFIAVIPYPLTNHMVVPYYCNQKKG